MLSPFEQYDDLSINELEQDQFVDHLSYTCSVASNVDKMCQHLRLKINISHYQPTRMRGLVKAIQIRRGIASEEWASTSVFHFPSICSSSIF